MDAPFKAVVEPTTDYLLVRVTGQYDRKLLTETVRKVNERVTSERVMHVLADFRGLTGIMEVAELHEFGEMIPRTLPRGCCIALIVADLADEDHKFLETVARNRGAVLRNFAAIEDAEAWLKEPSA